MCSVTLRHLAVACILAGLPNGKPGMADAAAAPVARSAAFARAPAFASVALSPQGTLLAYSRQVAGRQQVVVRGLSDGRELTTLTVESRRERVRWCDWSAERWLLCGTISPLRAPDRIFEATRLYAIDTSSGEVHELNKRLPGHVHDAVIDLLPHRAQHVLLQLDRKGAGFPEVGELDVVSGALRSVVDDRPPVRHWLTDTNGEVRLGVGVEGIEATVMWRESGGEAWQVLLEQSLNDLDAIGPLGFAGRPDELLVLKHHDGRTALFRVSTAEPNAPVLLFSSPVYDISGPLVVDPLSGKLLAVDYLAEGPRRQFFDAAEARRQWWLDGKLPGKVNRVVDRSLDGRRQLVVSASDTDPPSLYLFDTDAPRLTLLGDQYPELESRPLSPMRPIVYRARDGQPIPAYLTMPSTAQPGPLAAVVLPHGGPETRDALQFDPLVQFLAAHGFLVLQMNYRGSLGYGAGFAAAGAGRWGGVIHNDITDGTRWLVEQGMADPARICIVGESFGGYAAMLAATRESHWYACAASFAGVSDLMALEQYEARVQGAELWEQRMGADQRALWQMSPIARARLVQTPMLIMHGRFDATVPVSQSRRFARELRQAGQKPRYLERADCDHEMTIDACRLAFFEELSHFLQAQLGDDP